MAGAPRPFDGLLVLDLGRIYRGPHAGFLPATAGAAVAKVEPPGGEPLRRRAAAAGGAGGHWRGLLRAMGRDDLLDAPRFAANAARVARMAEVDGMAGGWTRGFSRAEGAAQRSGVPAAPVRDLEEVVNDPRLHERGALRWLEQPEVGRVALPPSPLRSEGAPAPEIVPGAPRNGDGAEVLGGVLGMADAEREAFRASGAVGPGPGAA